MALVLCVALWGVPAFACDSNCGVRDAVAGPDVPASAQDKGCNAEDCGGEPVILFGRVLEVTRDVDNPNQKIITLGQPDAPMVFPGPRD